MPCSEYIIRLRVDCMNACSACKCGSVSMVADRRTTVHPHLITQLPARTVPFTPSLSPFLILYSMYMLTFTGNTTVPCISVVTDFQMHGCVLCISQSTGVKHLVNRVIPSVDAISLLQSYTYIIIYVHTHCTTVCTNCDTAV